MWRVRESCPSPATRSLCRDGLGLMNRERCPSSRAVAPGKCKQAEVVLQCLHKPNLCPGWAGLCRQSWERLPKGRRFPPGSVNNKPELLPAGAKQDPTLQVSPIVLSWMLIFHLFMLFSLFPSRGFLLELALRCCHLLFCSTQARAGSNSPSRAREGCSARSKTSAFIPAAPVPGSMLVPHGIPSAWKAVPALP